MIVNAISGVFGQVFSAITASVGNLLVEENSKKTYEVYKKMILLNFWLVSFCSISIFCMMEPFILIWIGQEYVLSKMVLFMIVIVFYMQNMKKTLKVFKEGAGKFEEDRYIPLLESLINIISSVLFVKYFGLVGVLIGTFLSTLVLYLYSFPKLVYKDIFNRRYSDYIIEYFNYIIIMLTTLLITYIIIKIVNVNNNWLQLFINGIICLCIPNVIFFILFHRREEYEYYKIMIKNKLREKKNV